MSSLLAQSLDSEELAMNAPSSIKDNVAELLVKIIEFTQTRQKTLIQNIENIHSADFIPQDLAVEEFCTLLSDAVDAHSQSQCLVFCDTENIKFGAAGAFEARPTLDKHSKHLLDQDQEEYLQSQINKLLENSLNQRIAAELLTQKEGKVSIFD